MKTKLFTLFTVLLCIVVFSSCSKDDEGGTEIKINTRMPITLNHKETLTIDATSVQTITYSSDNEFHAKVSRSGVVTANYVGETMIILDNGSDSKSIHLRVEPLYKLYETPSIEWGKTKREIIAKYGNPDSETDTAIGYMDYSTNAPIAMFLFDDNQRLKSSSVIVKIAYTSTLSNFLLERYMPIDVNAEEYTATFVNGLEIENVTTGINLSLYNLSYMMVIYFDARDTSNTTRTIENIDIDDYTQIVESLIKNK